MAAEIRDDHPAARNFVTARPTAATAASTNWRISDSRTGGKNASDTGLDGAFTSRMKRTARFINGRSGCGCPPSRTKSQARRVGDMGAFGPSAHALFVTVGHSRPPGCRGKRDGRQASGCRRQPVFGSRAGARADVTAPGPGCRRDGWPGCCGQHKSNTSPGPGGIQHADNTYKTAFPGTPWHWC